MVPSVLPTRAGLPFVVLLLFAPFAALARAVTAQHMPLTLLTDGTVALTLTVDGTGPFRFLLDTGSAGTVVSDDLARRLGAPAVARAEMTTVAGIQEGVVVRLGRIGVGPHAVDGLLAGVVPAARLAAATEPLDGVLGQDFLARFDYTIDYQRGRLEWDDAAGPPPAGTRLPLEPVAGRFLVPLSQSDGATLRVVPDSGASGLVVYERPAGPRLPVLMTGRRMRVDTLTGRRFARSGTLVELRVGTMTLRRSPVTVLTRDDWQPAFGDALLPLNLFGRVSFRARDRLLVVSERSGR
jgi:predicted aspartyl protease